MLKKVIFVFGIHTQVQHTQVSQMSGIADALYISIISNNNFNYKQSLLFNSNKNLMSSNIIVFEDGKHNIYKINKKF